MEKLLLSIPNNNPINWIIQNYPQIVFFGSFVKNIILQNDNHINDVDMIFPILPNEGCKHLKEFLNNLYKNFGYEFLYQNGKPKYFKGYSKQEKLSIHIVVVSCNDIEKFIKTSQYLFDRVAMINGEIKYFGDEERINYLLKNKLIPKKEENIERSLLKYKREKVEERYEQKLLKKGWKYEDL